MAVASPCYTQRDTVRRAIDPAAALPRRHTQIDRLMQAASRQVDQACNRVFYPTLTTRYFDWPTSYTGSRGRSWEIWLDANELISVVRVVAGPVIVPIGDVLLEPVNSGPPYNRIEIRLDSSSSFSGAGSWQRAVAVTGLFGHSAAEVPAGTTVGPMTSSQTTMTVTDSSVVSPGALVRLDTERVQVTDATMAPTGVTSIGTLTASATDVLVEVGPSVSTFAVGETILLDAERMLVMDTSGTRLVVRRAWDGSVISAHGATPVSAPRLLTLSRGFLGTTTTGHAAGAAAFAHAVPAPVEQVTTALTLYGLWAEKSGMSPVPTTQTATTAARKRPVESPAEAMLADLVGSYGRKARTRAI